MKQSIKNRFFLLITALLIIHTACAQNGETSNSNAVTGNYENNDLSVLADYLDNAYCPREISFWTASGLSFLNRKPAFGGAFGLGYTYFLNKNWGMTSGAEYAFCTYKTDIEGFSSSFATSDIFGNSIIYKTEIENYSEKQKIGLLNIPFAVLYQSGDNHKFYTSVGVKIGLPVYAKYSNNGFILKTAGYYPDYDQTEIWQNDLGYGVFNIPESENKLNLGISYLGTVETGIKWDIGIGTSLYTGIFADYCFNNMLKSDNSEKQFIEYNHKEPSKPLNNTVSVLSDRYSPFNFGFKLKLAFSVGCRDLLNAQKSYKAIQEAQNDDFVDFTTENKNESQKQTQMEVKSENSLENKNVDTFKTATNNPLEKLPSKISAKDSVSDDLEREAYLQTAKVRRNEYGRSLNGFQMGGMGNYDLGNVVLTDEQKDVLHDYALFLVFNPTFTLDITGHTCDLGGEELNLRIGQERADLAKDFLVENGVAPSRIATFSKGKSEPLFPNTNEENRKKNRRLEFVIKK